VAPHFQEGIMDVLTTTSPYAGPRTSPLGGHDARQGFCPICGGVAPCYRALRAQALGRRSTTRPGSSPTAA
jgi:hypothetical protein